MEQIDNTEEELAKRRRDFTAHLASMARPGTVRHTVTQHAEDFEHHEYVCRTAEELQRAELNRRGVRFLPRQVVRKALRRKLSAEDTRTGLDHLDRVPRGHNRRMMILDEAWGELAR